MDQAHIIHSGALYYHSDESIMSRQLRCPEKLYAFNATRPLEQEIRAALLKEVFAEIGDGCYIEPPLHGNWIPLKNSSKSLQVSLLGTRRLPYLVHDFPFGIS